MQQPTPSAVPSRWVPALAVAAVAIAAVGAAAAAWWAQRGPSERLQARQNIHAQHPSQKQAVKAPARAAGLKRDADCRDCAGPQPLREDRL